MTEPATVLSMLRRAFAAGPQDIAAICGDERLSYQGYVAAITALAQELAGLGIGGPHSRVCLIMGNALDSAVAMFAVQATGALLVPLNPTYTVPELAPMLRDAAPSLVIFDDARQQELSGLLRSLPNCRLLAVGAASRRLTASRDEMALAAQFAHLPLPDPHSLSTIQYTGGTTGRAKGAMLTHAAIAVNVAQREALLPTRRGERILVMTPLFHVYAQAMGLYLAPFCQGTLVILPRYRPDLVIRAVRDHKITLFCGTPTIYTGLPASPDFASADWSSLRLCCSGSAALPEAVLRQWQDSTGCPICEGYGQTEAGPILTHNPAPGLRKAGSVGVALPHTSIEIVDPADASRILPAGSIGEIRARGPQIMSGYFGLKQETADALRDGWLYTGDLGSLDEDGYLYIRGRNKDMVIVSGFNVYPREVEEVLFAYPGILDAAVVGVPDSYRGEKLVGYLVGDPVNQTDLQTYLAGHLTGYKVPQEFRFIDRLPRTAAGKVDKRQLVSLHDN
jgi:long-chain acyl-CoA synthetase